MKERPMTGGDYLVRRIAELEGNVATLLDKLAAVIARAEAAEKERDDLKAVKGPVAEGE